MNRKENLVNVSKARKSLLWGHDIVFVIGPKQGIWSLTSQLCLILLKEEGFYLIDSLKNGIDHLSCVARKTCLRGFRQGLIQTGLYNNRRWLETLGRRGIAPSTCMQGKQKR